MRFIHMADVHLGAVPDSGCPWSAFRENEIWETFVRVIDQIREENRVVADRRRSVSQTAVAFSDREGQSAVCIHTGYRGGVDGRKPRLSAGRLSVS